MKHTQITCCHNCNDRHAGCHSICETYIQQKKEHDEFVEADRKEKEYYSYLNTVNYKTSAKKRRSRR